MPTLTAEAPLLFLDTATKFQPAQESQNRTGILFVGETTIVNHPAEAPDVHKNQTLDRIAFQELLKTMGPTEQTASNQGFTVGRRLTRLGKGPFTLLTWGAGHDFLIKDGIGRPYRDMQTHIQPVEGDMRETVVFQKNDGSSQEEITIDTPAAMPSDFATAIDGSYEHVVIGALPEEDWRTSLHTGLTRLDKTHTPYTVLLGDAKRNAVITGKDSQVVYDEIEKAHSLIVTVEDLKLLIGKHRSKQTPANALRTLLEQARVLGPQYIFAVSGRDGFLGGSVNSTMWVYADRNGKPVSDEAYMNAFIAGVVSGDTLQDRLLRGSASASLLAEQGAQSTPPTENQLNARMANKVKEDDLMVFPSSTG